MIYNRNLLKKINEVEVNGIRLSDTLIYDKYNVWQFYQQIILFKELTYSYKKQSKKMIKILDIVSYFFVVVISFISFIWAAFLKKRILVYSVDRVNSDIFNNDFRMDPTYQALKKYGHFIEVVHTVYGREMFKNFLKRRRPVIYLEAIDLIYSVIAIFFRQKPLLISSRDLNNFVSEEKTKVEGIIHKYYQRIPLSVWRTKIFVFILKVLGIRVVLSIDDLRNYHELMLAASLVKIESAALQHGASFNKNYVAHLKDPSFRGEFVSCKTFFVWSEYWKNEILRLGTYFGPNSIEIAGLPVVKANIKKIPSSRPLAILIPFETQADKKKIREYIDHILKIPEVKIFFKVRKDRSKNEQKMAYGLTSDANSPVTVVTSIHQCLDQINLVIGFYSTFLYDMILYERPIAVLNSSDDSASGLIENQLAEYITLGPNFYDDLQRCAETPRDVLQKRKEKLFGKNPKLASESLERYLEKIL